MDIKKNAANNVMTLRLEGWLDTNSAPLLGKALEELGDASELILDFDALEYISSSGLREVVAAYKLMRGRNGSFSVINVSEEIMDVFSMAGFDRKLSLKRKEMT